MLCGQAWLAVLLARKAIWQPLPGWAAIGSFPGKWLEHEVIRWISAPAQQSDATTCSRSSVSSAS